MRTLCRQLLDHRLPAGRVRPAVSGAGLPRQCLVPIPAGTMAVGDTAGLGFVGLVPLSHRWNPTDAVAVAGRKVLHAAATAAVLAVVKLGVSRAS